MATEVIQFQAQQATYELTAWARKAELQNDKLTKEIAVQVHKRKRVEESMEDGKRELERQQRLINKHDRQLQINAWCYLKKDLGLGHTYIRTWVEPRNFTRQLIGT
jgi:hypothetical protein